MSNRKLAIILGGSSGVGRALTSKLNEMNIAVAVVSRSAARNQKAITSNPSIIDFYECDARDEESLRTTFGKILSKHKHVDFLVNCIGSSESRSLLEDSTDGFSNDIDANLKAPYLAIFFVINSMSPGGAIVNISSIRAKTGTPSGLGYAAAKAGVINLTKSAALQLANKGIRVNCIVPSAIYPTGMSSHWTPEKLERIRKGIPFGRLSTPEEIANIIYFFLSDDSQLITGQILDVNGGELII